MQHMASSSLTSTAIFWLLLDRWMSIVSHKIPRIKILVPKWINRTFRESLCCPLLRRAIVFKRSTSLSCSTRQLVECICSPASVFSFFICSEHADDECIYHKDYFFENRKINKRKEKIVAAFSQCKKWLIPRVTLKTVVKIPDFSILI